MGIYSRNTLAQLRPRFPLHDFNPFNYMQFLLMRTQCGLIVLASVEYATDPHFFVVEHEGYRHPPFKPDDPQPWPDVVALGATFRKFGKSFAVGADTSDVIDSHSRVAATAVFDVLIELG